MVQLSNIECMCSVQYIWVCGFILWGWGMVLICPVCTFRAPNMKEQSFRGCVLLVMLISSHVAGCRNRKWENWGMCDSMLQLPSFHFQYKMCPHSESAVRDFSFYHHSFYCLPMIIMCCQVLPTDGLHNYVCICYHAEVPLYISCEVLFLVRPSLCLYFKSSLRLFVTARKGS